jgi:yecA family protein
MTINSIYQKIEVILKKNNSFSINKLDGFLTAVISSPDVINVLNWMKIAKLYKLDNKDLLSIMKFYNKIYEALKNGNYVPIFINIEHLTDEPVVWANGYIQGKNLWSKRILNLHLEEIDVLLGIIMDLSLCSDLKLAKINNQILGKVCVNIYNFWLKQ